jgi:hypothetical protein
MAAGEALDVPALIHTTETLCRHVAGLQRDVQRLYNRLGAVDEEHLIPGVPGWDDVAANIMKEVRRSRSDIQPAAIVTVLRQADEQLKTAERALNYLASQFEQIANDAYLSADLKDWLREAQRRRERSGRSGE